MGLLPAIPFGWRGSGLAVAEGLLTAVLQNLLNSLREDGFSRVFALIPQDMTLGLNDQAIVLPHSSQFAPAPLLPAASDVGKVVVIPIGHTEQHGYHLPLSTDNLIIEAIGNGVGTAVPDHAVTLPTFPYGVSTHRQSFAGTLNVQGRAFEDFWLAVVDGLVGRGFDRFYLMSGHGGNCSFLVNVVKYAGSATAASLRHGLAAHLRPHRWAGGAGNRYSSGRHGARGRAGNSDDFAFAPRPGAPGKAVDEIDFISTPSYYTDWIEAN
ncbi:MAG: creatininase family protein [Ardenticatenaceae bacterium]|nr:creatininase family protein [Ardenticatenaceae bacterium]